LLSQFDGFATAAGQTASSTPAGSHAFAAQGNVTGSGIPLGGSQNLTSGTLELTGLSGDTTTQSGRGCYPIHSSRTIAIEVDGQQLGLLFLEAVFQ
jgi:hypothetical protein